MKAYVGALLSASAAQEIDTATETLVAFNEAEHDVGGFFSDTLDALVIPVALDGYYHIYGSVQWEADGTGIRWLEVRKNGTAYFRTTMNTVTGHSLTQTVSLTLSLEVGDIITLYCYQTSGGGLDVEYSDDYTPHLGVDLMGV